MRLIKEGYRAEDLLKLVHIIQVNQLVFRRFYLKLLDECNKTAIIIIIIIIIIIVSSSSSSASPWIHYRVTQKCASIKSIRETSSIIIIIIITILITILRTLIKAMSAEQSETNIGIKNEMQKP